MKLLIAGLVVGGLSLLWLFTYKFTCLSVFFVFVMIVVILMNEFKLKLIQRRCFANCYINQNSFWYTFFQGGVFAFLSAFFSSVVFGVAYGVYLVKGSVFDYIFIGISVLLSYVIYVLFNKNGILSESVKFIISKNFASFSAALIVAVLIVVIEFNQTPPAYLDNSLSQTIKNASLIYSSCSYLNDFFELLREIEALEWWGIMKFSVGNVNFYVKFIVWALFLFGNILALIGVNKMFLIIYERIFNGKK